ncbi:hypothetical protein GR11A_00046 [Vibrio phage vB_VcorM_GR11A]|nr:hypothetical protein GR11A_00046 [Vibrio phage vB_VcorM_GR11A]
MSTLLISTSLIPNVVDDNYAPKGLTIIEQNESGVLVEFTRPRTQKRDRRFIPSELIVMVVDGGKEADSGNVVMQQLGNIYDEVTIESYEVEGGFITATDADGNTYTVPAGLAYIAEFDVEAEAPKSKKKAAPKADKKEKAGKGKKGGKKGGKKDDAQDWED